MSVPQDGLIVFVYHLIDNPAADDFFGLKVPAGEFRKQLEYLKHLPVRFVSIEEIEAAPAQKDSRVKVLVTFDDGYRNFLEKAKPILDEYRIPAVIFQNCAGLQGKKLADNDFPQELMSAEELRILANAEGYSLQSHLLSHTADPASLADRDLAFELSESKKILEDITGRQVKYFSCPHGRIDKRMLAEARRQGYRGVFTSFTGFNPVPPGILINRINVSGHDSFRVFKQKCSGAFNWKRSLQYLLGWI